jgi:type IV secretory pathway VirB3-like protein
MAADPEFHPVYKALTRRPELWGVDQRYIGLGPGLGVVIFLASRFSLVGLAIGLVAVIVVYVLGRWMYRHEPQIVPMLYRACQLAPRYDPLKHEPVYVERVKTW